MSKRNRINLCPCGSGRDYSDCCGRFIDGDQAAPTPEALMRSRYTAYCLGNEDYLLATWHPSTRPQQLNLASQPTIKWTGLEILSAPELEGNEGLVEFVARFKQSGRAGQLHENSRFLRKHGEWFYVTGELENR